MGLRDIVRSGVAIANKLTADLQPTVGYEKYLGSQDVRGVPQRAPSIPLAAIVEMKQQLVKVAGEFITARAKVTFLDPTVVIHLKDRIVLPDATSGPILETEGFVDRVTTRPYLTEVFIGTFK